MLSYDDAERLKSAGYTEWEIEQFSEGRTPDGKDQPSIDLNNIVWQKAMASRRKWKDNLIADGWTEQQFVQSIYDQYNKDPKQSPWDFLKSEYKPPQKADFRSTLDATVRVRQFKTGVRRELRQERRKLESEFHEETLGETIRRLKQQDR